MVSCQFDVCNLTVYSGLAGTDLDLTARFSGLGAVLRLAGQG